MLSDNAVDITSPASTFLYVLAILWYFYFFLKNVGKNKVKASHPHLCAGGQAQD